MLYDFMIKESISNVTVPYGSTSEEYLLSEKLGSAWKVTGFCEASGCHRGKVAFRFHGREAALYTHLRS